MDAQVDLVMRYLESSPFADAVVIFTSDHGSNLMDHGIFSKANFFEASWRVPFIIAGGDVTKNRVDHSHFVSGVDLAATIAAIAGTYIPGGHGFDLRHLSGANRRCCGVAGALMQLFAVVTPYWKLVHDLPANDGQLFHRTLDPHEKNNLYADPAHVGTRDQLLLVLMRWHAALVPTEQMKANLIRAKNHSNTPSQSSFTHWWTNGMQGNDAELQLQRDLVHLSLTTDLGCGAAIGHRDLLAVQCGDSGQLRTQTSMQLGGMSLNVTFKDDKSLAGASSG